MSRAISVLAVLATIVGGVVVLLPGTASAADLVPTTLGLTGPTSAGINTTATVSATLTATPDSSPVADQPVQVQRWTGTDWTTAATVTTAADGTATTSVPIKETSNRFRAVYAGDGTHAASVSPTLTITGTRNPTRLTLGGDRSVIDEQTAHLVLDWRTTSGTPVPGRVRVYQHVRNGTWKLLRRVDLGADGHARIGVRPRVDTWYQLRGSRGPWWQAATSASHFVDNRPPMTPIRLPADAPRPRSLPAQRRAVGAGANITASRIPNRVWRQMTGITWHRGCPVGRSGLRLLHLNYWGFDGYRHRGELVVNRQAVSQFRGAFRDLYAGRFPIRAMYRVDRFGYSKRSGGGDDFASMRHDNTSAFNCRWVTGNPGVRSPHSRGFAVDINTWENPYRSKVGLLPNSWWMGHSNPRYAWRSSSHAVVRIMARHGFRWTYGLGDTQHFDA
ncbi:MAG TPA: M15 family metallopeptidase [Marmoricola sp.]|nr:M15 family metallopeptidase [Marmoricola sp.]